MTELDNEQKNKPIMQKRKKRHPHKRAIPADTRKKLRASGQAWW